MRVLQILSRFKKIKRGIEDEEDIYHLYKIYVKGFCMINIIYSEIVIYISYNCIYGYYLL